MNDADACDIEVHGQWLRRNQTQKGWITSARRQRIYMPADRDWRSPHCVIGSRSAPATVACSSTPDPRIAAPDETCRGVAAYNCILTDHATTTEARRGWSQ